MKAMVLRLATLGLLFPGAASSQSSDSSTGVVGEEAPLEDVVVTGSRIKRKDLTTPAPVTLLSKESFQASGKASLGDFLQTLPEQGNAINTGVDSGGDGSTRVSLRSLGPARTLVLINGRRSVPTGTGADASVDLNSIPAGAIERIELLKDGASSVYGSDAIAGVVNIITRKNWSGTDVTAYAGTSSHNDAQIVDFAATTGAAGEKGSIVFSVGYNQQWATMAGDRTFSEFQYFYDQTGRNNSRGTPGEYTGGSSRTPGGRVSTGGTGNAAFNALTAANPGFGYLIHDPAVGPGNAGYDACLAAGGSATSCQWRGMNTSGSVGSPIPPAGDLYNYAAENYLQTPAQRISIYASGDTRFGSWGRGYFEASYVNTQAKQRLAPEPLIIGPGGVLHAGGNLVTISPYNQYNPFGKEFASASMRMTAFGPRTHEEDLGTLRTVLGVDGTLGEAFGPLRNWLWDLSMNYGRSYGTYTIGGSLISSRVAAALGPSQGGVCYQSYDPANPVNGGYSNPISGCVPLDLFHGSSAVSPAAVAYLGFTGTSSGRNEMTTYQFNTGGDMFKLWSDRPTGLALGVERRLMAGNFINDPLTAHFDSSNGGGYDTSGSYQATEGYLELTIPLVSHRAGIDDLELSVAGRAFWYSNSGSDTTYKVGARYRPIRDVTLRGTYSTAFRAPSITDLYSGQYDSFPSVSDPCAGNPAGPGSPGWIDPASPLGLRCGLAVNNGDDSNHQRTTGGGNPDLKPETATTYTIGLVFEPTFLSSFTAAVDYYSVAVDGAIGPIGASTIVGQCYDPAAPARYCDLVARDPLSHLITNIRDLNQNVGGEGVAGIDLALRYVQPTDSVGRLAFTFDGTWLQKHDRTLPDGTVIHGKGTYDLQASSGQGGSNPEWKFNLGVIWGLRGFGAGLSTRYIGGFKECGNSSGDYSGSGFCYVDSTYSRKVSSFSTWDMFLSYAFTSVAGRTNAIVGVNNLADAQPPKIYNGFASSTDQYTYDQVGRYYYVRLAQAF